MKRILILASVILGGLLAAVTAAPLAASPQCRNPRTEGPGTQVALQNLCFEPTILYIAPGETVTWTNFDAEPHTVTSATLVWDNANLEAGDTFSVTFDTPGIYPYYCILHYYMGGAVVVGELDDGLRALLSALEDRQDDLLSTLDAREQAFLVALEEQENQTQEDLLASLNQRQSESEQSLPQDGLAQAVPLLVSLAALGGGLGGAALTVAFLRRKS